MIKNRLSFLLVPLIVPSGGPERLAGEVLRSAGLRLVAVVASSKIGLLLRIVVVFVIRVSRVYDLRLSPLADLLHDFLLGFVGFPDFPAFHRLERFSDLFAILDGLLCLDHFSLSRDASPRVIYVSGGVRKRKENGRRRVFGKGGRER